ncbi:MAG: low temperature requirement protein A [Limosilactobacillus sp.]|uniref:low temperature requirement protein A n=1 Tax=Limosilactobacillus sp. TaxID=2773925 RepID=UPI0026FCFC79|nr:low temperature requirement protein A [Limosilactobacillus sp.]
MNILEKVLGKPRIFEEQIRDRKISWLELFYDLMFAVLFAKISDTLVEIGVEHHHLGLHNLGYAIVVFVWLIWGWNEISGYFDNHGNDSLFNLLAIYTEMVLSGVAIIFVPEAIEGHFGNLIIWLTLIELLMAVIWLYLAAFDRTHGPASRVWGVTHLIVFLIMVGGILIGKVTLPILLLALATNLLTVIIANPWLAREYSSIQREHQVSDSMIERYGLLTMIAFGEIIAGLYEWINVKNADSSKLTMFLLLMVFAALLTAVYYQVLGSLKIVRHSSIGIMMIGYLFLATVLAVVMMGSFIILSLKTGAYHFKLGFSISTVAYFAGVITTAIFGIEEREHGRTILRYSLLFIEAVAFLAIAYLPVVQMIIAANIIAIIMIIQRKFLFVRS